MSTKSTSSTKRKKSTKTTTTAKEEKEASQITKLGNEIFSLIERKKKEIVKIKKELAEFRAIIIKLKDTELAEFLRLPLKDNDVVIELGTVDYKIDESGTVLSASTGKPIDSIRTLKRVHSKAISILENIKKTLEGL